MYWSWAPEGICWSFHTGQGLVCNCCVCLKCGLKEKLNACEASLYNWASIHHFIIRVAVLSLLQNVCTQGSDYTNRCAHPVFSRSHPLCDCGMLLLRPIRWCVMIINETPVIGLLLLNEGTRKKQHFLDKSKWGYFDWGSSLAEERTPNMPPDSSEENTVHLFLKSADLADFVSPTMLIGRVLRRKETQKETTVWYGNEVLQPLWQAGWKDVPLLLHTSYCFCRFSIKDVIVDMTWQHWLDFVPQVEN